MSVPTRSKSPALADPLREPLKAKSHARNRAARRASEHERRAETITRRNDLLPELKLELRPLDELVP